jgi:MerR family mercuric resistance operon transcriptional regulator
LGFSLDEIRSLLHLSESPDLACRDVDALARQHLVEVREKLAQLQRMEAELVATIERCRGGQRATCAVLESLARETPGVSGSVSIHSSMT